jgi:hypothetical protein
VKAVNATASFMLALICALTAAVGIAAAVEAHPSLMSRADRLAALTEIERAGRLAISRCRDIAQGAERAICRAQARATERISAANLEARYRGTFQALEDVRHAQARAAHSLGAALRLVAT